MLEIEIKILSAFIDWEFEKPNRYRQIKKVAERLGMPCAATGKAMRSLAQKNILRCDRGLVDAFGGYAGSGYLLAVCLSDAHAILNMYGRRS